MSQRLDHLLPQIRADLLTTPGMRRIHDSVPEALNEFPAVVVAATSGSCWMASHARENGATPMMCAHLIRIEVHIPRKDLPTDVELLTTLADDVMVWLYSGFARDHYQATIVTPGDPRTANNATAPLDYTIGPAEWGGQQTYAFLCDFMVTTEQDLN